MAHSQMDACEIQELGASLRRIDPKLIVPETPSGTMRVWYQGGELYFDLFVDLREGEVEWFQFTLRGRSLLWSRQDDPSTFRESPWQTGETHELQTEDVTLHPASKVVTSDRAFNHSLLAVARAILATRNEDPILVEVFKICNAPFD